MLAYEYLSIKYKSKGNLDGSLPHKPTSLKCLILDCDDVVNIDIFQVLHDESSFIVRECYHATENTWGNIYLEKIFIEYLKEIFSTEFIEYSQIHMFTAWQEMMRDFNYWKRNFKINDDTSDVPISLLFKFISECERYHNNMPITEIVKKSQVKSAEVDMDFGKLMIKDCQMQKMLMTQIQKIVDEVHLLMQKMECHCIDAIALIGAFSECCLLQNTITQEFKSQTCNIIIPVAPTTAIMRGAIFFSLNSTITLQRLSAYTHDTSKLLKGNTNIASYIYRETEVFKIINWKI